MLKQLTVTGIAAAGIAGGILLAAPAGAESVTNSPCSGAYCPGYQQYPGYQDPGYQDPGYQNPGYQQPGHHYGWGRWYQHHPWNQYRHQYRTDPFDY